MPARDVLSRIKLRRGTSAQWLVSDPVLAAGEVGLDTTLNMFKIGDGVSTWSVLPFASALASDVPAWAKSPTKPSYTHTEVGAAAASHNHTKANITDFPASMPASDVSAWAKSATKPAYTPAEVGALASGAKAADSDKLDGYHASDFAAATHEHSAADITSGTLPVARGGTGVTTTKDIALLSYPVGAIYMSYVSTSPATLFGGTWSAITTGKFLRTGTGGATGGSDTHVHSTAAVALTVEQMPSHRHVQSYKLERVTLGTTGVAAMSASLTGDDISKQNTQYTGGGATHGHGNTGSASNVPAYYEVYAWRRTA